MSSQLYTHSSLSCLLSLFAPVGGLIASIAISRLPELVSRCVLTAPMFRGKCGLKCFDYKFPLPQPMAYWITYCACVCGLGSMRSIGFFKEDCRDKLKQNITTSGDYVVMCLFSFFIPF